MIQRYLYSILKTGVQAILDDPRILDDLFEADYVLEKTEVEAIKELFAAQGLTVINGYARGDTKFPAVAVILGDEREAETFLGDSAGQVLEDDDPLYGADIETAIWEYTFNILIITEHPDSTLYYYEIVKSILLAGLDSLSDDPENMFEYKMSGAELAPDPRYLPEHLFARQLTFAAQREFQRVRRDSLLVKAFALRGIHIDSSGSNSDVGGVQTLVEIYREGES